jgi:hypothetical protein
MPPWGSPPEVGASQSRDRACEDGRLGAPIPRPVDLVVHGWRRGGLSCPLGRRVPSGYLCGLAPPWPTTGGAGGGSVAPGAGEYPQGISAGWPPHGQPVRRTVSVRTGSPCRGQVVPCHGDGWGHVRDRALLRVCVHNCAAGGAHEGFIFPPSRAPPHTGGRQRQGFCLVGRSPTLPPARQRGARRPQPRWQRGGRPMDDHRDGRAGRAGCEGL